MFNFDIGDKNTWSDWHLAPTSRPAIKAPEPKTYSVELKGVDGVLDYTESLTGEVAYKNRTGTLEFLVVPDYMNWHRLYTEISNAIHGVKKNLVYSEDPSWYYKGRLTITDWASAKSSSKIKFKYDLEPYKYQRWGTDEDWMWDEFNFDTDCIREWRDLRVDTARSLTFTWSRKSVTPEFYVNVDTEGETIKIGLNDGEAIEFSEGVSRNARIRLIQGENTLYFYGNGYVSVHAVEGSL